MRRRLVLCCVLGVMWGLGLLAGGLACQEGSPQADTPDMAAVDPCQGTPTTGRCVDAQTIAACITGTSGPRLVQNKCASGYSCVTEDGGAFCKLTASCREGQSRCAGTISTETCEGGAWKATACAAASSCKSFPGLGGACVPNGVGVTVQGTLRYERRLPNATNTGFAAPSGANAAGVFVELIDGSTILGSGFTNDQGQFSVSGWRAPSASGRLLFIPIGITSSDAVAYAVALPLNSDTFSVSPGLWYFPLANLPAATGGVINVGTVSITGEDAGAIHIFSWLRTHFARMQQVFGRGPAQSVVVLWKPDLDISCGACFVSRAGGGTDIGSGTSALHFDSSILLSGSTQSPIHWSQSVINHEIGHFVMDQFSKPPGEGGPHFLNSTATAGLAWSEGFATWDGQATMSMGQTTPNPIYFTQQEGTAFFIDISKASSPAVMIPQPSPSGPIDQNLSEIIVAAIAWDLWRAGGDLPVSSAVALPRITSGANRGYKTVDLVDFADALQCAGRIPAAQLASTMSKFKFPWDNQPLCSP